MIRRAVSVGLTSLLALIFGVAPLSAHAQNLPAGSYLQSCGNVTFGGGQLTASCSAPNGQRHTSSTSLNCNGDIGNVSGYLRCNGAGSSGGHHHHHHGGNSSGSLPSGSYQQSCTNARVYGGTLRADCSASNGGRVASSTSVNCGGDIGNVNGSLRCNGGGDSGGFVGGGAPGGSYQQSCTNVRMAGASLTASCSAPNGQRITSSVDVRTCRGTDIGNRNGYLGCGR
jgi:hypothetical protein